MDISELNLSVREFNAVKRFGINTTEELIERLPEFCRHSKKAGAAVTEQLHKLGLLPFHLGEWVEPERCGDELLPEEFREGEFVIMGFPTESRDWRKVVLIIKIDGTEMYFIDDKRDLMHHTIGDRKCWRIAGERGQAPAVPELEALGVPKFDRDILANYEVTSLDELKQHLHSLCRACPGAVREVYTALQEAGQVLFVPGDEPEDTALIGEEISFTELEKMVGEPVIYAPSEYDEPCAVLITRVLPGTVWLWGDLRNPYLSQRKILKKAKYSASKTRKAGQKIRRKTTMETQNIQATITLTLTKEQLMMLLNAPPTPVQTAAPTPAAPVQMAAQPTAPNLAQMFPTAAPAVPAAPAMTPPTVQTAIPGALPSAPVQPSQTPPPMPASAQQMPAQTAPQTYTAEQLGLAARPLVESGRREDLVALLAEFGVPSVVAIPENRRADFAARLRAMGGQI